MSAKTVFPRVVLDAGSGNVGVLTIPYVSYFTHYDLARGLGDLGTVRISVLNALQSGSATVSVFARFKEISLQIPTAVPNNLGTLSGLVSDFKKYVLSDPEALTPGFRDSLRALIGMNINSRRRRDLFDQYDDLDSLPVAQVGEAEIKAASGVVSTPLSTIGNMASMGTSLPVIGRYLTPISWIANAASSVAAFFGLSKSTNLRPIDKFVSIPAYGFTNIDGVDNSLVLGASIENEIGTRTDLFGSDLDEMDIPFVCKHESFLVSFPWNSSTIPGTQIFKCAVSPSAMAYVLRKGNPVFNSTAMGYVSSMFRYWRGSIKYKIQVTKTAYHSGRLRVSYVPSGGTDTAGYDFNQGYSEIVDLRTSDEIEFTIPFVSNTLWKPCILDQYDDPQFPESNTGVIIVEIINQLRRPDTVAAVLECNAWVSGGDDIQFAIPDFFQNVPVIDDTAVAELPYAQVLGQFQDTGFNATMNNDNQMFQSPTTEPIDASATSIGEHIQNLRQLIKRFGIIGSGYVGTNRSVKVQTNYFGETNKTSSITAHINMCPLDYVSWLYRFYRGGVRLKALCTPTNFSGYMGVLSNPGVVQAPAGPVLTSAQINAEYAAYYNNSGTFIHFIDTIYNRFIEILLPYFSNTHISLLRGTSVKPTEYDDRSSSAYFFGNFATASSTEGDGVTIFKAAADDFSFGWLVGPPKLQRIPPPGTDLLVTPAGAGSFAIETATPTIGAFVASIGNLFAPTLDTDVEDPDVRTIIYATIFAVTVIYKDDSSDDLPLVESKVAQYSTKEQRIYVVGLDTSKAVDEAKTLATFKSISPFILRVGDTP